MKHEPESTHFKWTLTFEHPPRSVEVRRVPCSCGWEGDWVDDWKQAALAFQAHRLAAKSEAVPA